MRPASASSASKSFVSSSESLKSALYLATLAMSISHLDSLRPLENKTTVSFGPLRPLLHFCARALQPQALRNIRDSFGGL